MNLGLDGKTAAVTGASSGIGFAISQALAEEGCNLVLVSRDKAKLANAAEKIRSTTSVSVTEKPGDLSIVEFQKEFSRSTADVDILVNCAGSNPSGEIDAISDEVWRGSWDLKVFGYIALTRSAFTNMKKRGSGVIVNVIGNSGERMNAKYILGSTGNLALMGLTRALGSRSPDFGVRVVGVNPGLTATERAKTLLKQWSQQQFETENRTAEVLAGMELPFGRMCKPEEIAYAVIFLCSSRASYISGTVLTVDGGASDRH